MSRLSRLLVGIGLTLVIMGCFLLYQNAPKVVAQDAEGSYEYVPLPENILQDKSVIEGWIQAGSIDAMRDHAWALWAGMTQDSGQSFNNTALPIWDTWYSGHDIYDIGPAAADANVRGTPHDLQGLRQLNEDFNAVPADEHQGVLGFNKFTQEAADHIWSNGYWLTTTLDTLLSQCDPNAAPQACAIQPFPSAAIATKPTFMLVAQNAITVIPVWAGVFPEQTTTWQLGYRTTSPNSGTWLQCVAIDQTGTHQPGDIIPATCNGQSLQARVVSLGDFYHFSVDQAEVDQFNALVKAQSPFAQPFIGTAQLADGTTHPITANDSLILVGMHVTTREIDEWTWQTFWWSPAPDDSNPAIWPPNADSTEQVLADGEMYTNYPGSGSDRPDSIPAPWSNYVMCTNYNFVNPPQPLVGGTDSGVLPEICFNPYLETAFSAQGVPSASPGGGINTNCMTCHGQATWAGTGKPSLPYVSANYVSRDDPRFQGYLQLDFAWNVTSAHITPTPSP